MAKRINLYRLYKRGETWWAYFSIPTENGHHRYRCSCLTSDKKQAELFCKEQLTQKTNHPKGKLTIDEAFGIFYQANAHNYSRPLEALRKLQLIKSYLPKYLDELTPQILNQYVLERQKKVKNATINKDLAFISAVLNKLDLLGYDIPKIKPQRFKLKIPAENVKYFDDIETVKKIVEAADDYFKPMIWTAVLTGMRRGNLLNLKWEELDFKNNLINILVKDKTVDGGRLVSIPIIPKLKKILENQPKINDYVFNYKGHPISDYKKAWHRAIEKAGVKYQNFHTLRHTTATWVLKETGNLKLTQQILGHKDIKTTMKYAHVLANEKRDALLKVFQ